MKLAVKGIDQTGMEHMTVIDDREFFYLRVMGSLGEERLPRSFLWCIRRESPRKKGYTMDMLFGRHVSSVARPTGALNIR